MAASLGTVRLGGGDESSLKRGLQRAQYVGALLPVAITLLRNPIVQELVIHAVAGRLRRAAGR
jgi:hypothetical protein